MSIEKAYNSWSEIYDSNKNRTRDLDEKATREVLGKYAFDVVLELGCGTGKNTKWLVQKTSSVTGFDFSEGMLAKARAKLKSPHVKFCKVNVKEAWPFPDNTADLVTCSLTLEHIEDLDFVFGQAARKLKKGGKFFISELHPFKQYGGTKARYETENGIEELEVYIHHVADFVHAGFAQNFRLLELDEWFDEDAEREIPRLLSLVFEK